MSKYFEEIKTHQNINLTKYKNYPSTKAINGSCIKNNLFSPDGENCYKCNSSIGMPRWNSQCSFSL